LLNEDKTKVQVIGEASSTKIWSADLASISHAVVCICSIRSTSAGCSFLQNGKIYFY